MEVFRRGAVTPILALPAATKSEIIVYMTPGFRFLSGLVLCIWFGTVMWDCIPLCCLLHWICSFRVSNWPGPITRICRSWSALRNSFRALRESSDRGRIRWLVSGKRVCFAHGDTLKSYHLSRQHSEYLKNTVQNGTSKAKTSAHAATKDAGATPCGTCTNKQYATTKLKWLCK